jgi:thiopeptide-type bacteriocin biosynthesis protein
VDTDTRPQHEDHVWLQVAIEFTDYATAEDTSATHLRPVLDNAETARLAVSWSFIRKAPIWRLRYLSAPDHAGAARQAVHEALDTLRENGRVAGWVETIYEPEVHAFGGPDAMTLAHELFHRDSQHILGGIRAPSAWRAAPAATARYRLDSCVPILTTTCWPGGASVRSPRSPPNPAWSWKSRAADSAVH